MIDGLSAQLQLYARLTATIESKNFLNRIEDMQQASVNGIKNQFPFIEATGVTCHPVIFAFSYVFILTMV